MAKVVKKTPAKPKSRKTPSSRVALSKAFATLSEHGVFLHEIMVGKNKKCSLHYDDGPIGNPKSYHCIANESTCKDGTACEPKKVTRKGDDGKDVIVITCCPDGY